MRKTKVMRERFNALQLFFKTLQEKEAMIAKNISVPEEWGEYLLSCLATILNRVPDSPATFPVVTIKFQTIVENLSRLYATRQMLADHNSKIIFDHVVAMYLALAFLPSEEVFLLFGLYDKQQWDEYVAKAKCLIKHAANDYILDRVETWILEGYSYGDNCRVAEGDVVIDAGAYTGNTAFYFQELAGSRGKVYSFEPNTDNYLQLEKNLHASGIRNITAINKAISNKEGIFRFNSSSSAAAAAHLSGSGDIEVKVTTIDKFIETEGLKKVNFIKMDIEGAESDALEGASDVIRGHHPKMAICVYHAKDDLFRIPEIIYSINPNYKFYLRHNAYSHHETVLFCEPAENPACLQDVPPESFKDIRDIFISLHQKLRVAGYRHFLELCIAHFAAQNNAPFEFLSDPPPPRVSDYIYMPFSRNKSDHFEIFVTAENIQISIHFEYAKKNHNTVELKAIKEIFTHLRQLSPQLEIEDAFHRLGCGFKLKRAEYSHKDLIRMTAALLNFLVKNSLPLLLRESLLSVPLAEFTLRTCPNSWHCRICREKPSCEKV